MTAEKSEASIRVAEKLRQFFHYDKNTGEFTRKIPRRNAPAGSTAGSLKKSGYVEISFDGTTYRRSRLAFLYVNGCFPERGVELDHVNGVRSDDRWCNLRSVNKALNQQNQKKAHVNNKCGLLGVSARKNGTFLARIKVNGEGKHLGVFDTAQKAHRAYLEAKRTYHETNTL